MGGGSLSYGFFLPLKPEPGRFYHFMCPLVLHYYYYKVYNSLDIIKDFNKDLYIYLVFLVFICEFVELVIPLLPRRNSSLGLLEFQDDSKT